MEAGPLQLVVKALTFIDHYSQCPQGYVIAMMTPLHSGLFQATPPENPLERTRLHKSSPKKETRQSVTAVKIRMDS